MDKNINLNQQISFKLTKQGKEHFQNVLNKEKEIYKYPTTVQLDSFLNSDGIYVMQLHEFMFSFGKEFFNGSPNYLENNELVFL